MYVPAVDKFKTKTRLGGRRKRTVAQPLASRIDIREPDIKLWLAYHYHGPLPTLIAFHFYGNKNLDTFKKRQALQFHGIQYAVRELKQPIIETTFDALGNEIRERRTMVYEHVRYLTRPAKLNPRSSLSVFAVHDLHDRALMELEKRDLLTPYIRRKDPLEHRFMGACITASMEIMAPQKGLADFLPRHRVLIKYGAQIDLSDPLRDPLALRLVVDDPVFPITAEGSNDAVYYETDELLALDYGGSYRAFICEWDRASETRATFRQKIRAIYNILRNRTYKKTWNVPGLMVLIVTTAPGRMKNMMEDAEQLDPVLCKRLLFKCYPTFGDDEWRAPGVLENILDPWYQGGGGMFDITKELGR